MTDPRDAELHRLRRIIENLNTLLQNGHRAWWPAWLLLMAGGLIGAWVTWWLR